MLTFLQSSIKPILFLSTVLVYSSNISLAQTTYLNNNNEALHLVDRMETKTGQINTYFNTAQQPLSRKALVAYLSELKLNKNVGHLRSTPIDEFNINRAISINGEWYENASGESGFVPSKRPILKYFYQTQTDFINVETNDFFLSVNPVLYLNAGKELNNSSTLTNTRGLELRGRIANKIGFYTFLADDQQREPSYVNNWANEHRGQFPGAHYAPLRGTNYDIFLARGYVDFGLIRNHVSVTFGYDKNQVGYGIRSLVLGDNAAPATFLRLRSHWGKFTYENLMLEQVLNNNILQNTDAILPRRYAAIHQLNYTPFDKLSIGIFESSVLGYSKGMPAGLLVPIIGYQSIAKQVSDNNSNNAWGLNFKALPVRDIQIYGQAFLDKVDLGKIGKGAWSNQYGVQLGIKYYDVATLKNLDGQIEFNAVRPFTYQGQDSGVAGFSHYNQPMAHPLGNNFYEVVGNLRYQPIPLLTISGRLVYSLRGVDTGVNYFVGNGIFQTADQRSFGDADAYPMLIGKKKQSIFGNLNIAYELRPNLYLEVGGNLLQSKVADVQLDNMIHLYGGLRLNIARNMYDYN